jgi:hypothetical protein
MAEHPTCIDCGTQAPETNTSYTLISATFGWRLTRKVNADGTRSVEWRCGNCFKKNKEHNQPASLAQPEEKAPPTRRGTLTERILSKKG